MPVTIRSRLVLLVLSVLVPGLLGAAWLIHTTVQAESRAHENMLRDTARALSMVVDRELAQRAAVARVLAQSRWLDEAPQVNAEQLANFEKLARRAMVGMEGWVELHAADRRLFDSRLGAAATPTGTAEGLIDRPLVLPLQSSAAAREQEAHAALVQPVERDGKVVLNLRVALMPAELQRIVDAQKLPPDWVGTVMDDQGVVLARHPGGKAHIGRQATADLRARMRASPEGLFESLSLDGIQATGYYSISSQGWSYVSAMPREQFSGLGQRAVLKVTLGAMLLVALAVAGAFAVARRIAEPVGAMKQAAARMQAGQPVLAGSTGLAECDEVVRSMSDAADAIARGRSELQAQVAAAVERTRQAEQRLSQGQRVEALGCLTGGIAHDFNNLLGVISNSAHLMARHPAAGELQVPLAATLRAVDTGSRLTQHLLRFAGHRPVRPQVLALAPYFADTLQLVRSVLGSRCEILVHVEPDTAPVRVDPSELELALINLALNARDAMPGGGELRLVARNADALDLEDFGGPDGLPSQPWVLITVGDNGAGVEPEVAARVFEPFFTTKPVGQGTGLGLSQVHGFCTQAGGAARLASTPGVGTTVSMLLPALQALPPQSMLQSTLPSQLPSQLPSRSPSRPATPDPAAGSPVLGARVLLVDDNHALGDVTEALLKTYGAHVSRADSAAQALRELAAQPQLDVVLSDVVMAGDMDGLAMARAMRRQRPTLPVVLISGFGNAAAMSEFPCLRKPCPPQDLLAALGAAIAAGPLPPDPSEPGTTAR